MSVIVLENLAKKLMLGVVDSLDDVLIISREIEKAAALSRRPKLGKYVFARQGHKVVGRIETEQRP